MPESLAGSAAALADPPSIIDDWLRRYEASTLRVPKAVDLRTFVGPARGIVATLAFAFAEDDCAPGTPALRESEKLFAFAGGNLGMGGASAFEVCAFVDTLRDALVARAHDAGEKQALARLFDWMTALALEAYASSRLDALRLRHRDSLEKGTPVVMVTRELPAAFLVGEPERVVLEAVFGRLLLSVLSGLPPAAEPLWLAAFPTGAAVTQERFEDAVARALSPSRLR
jgi:hypothetical protein